MPEPIDSPKIREVMNDAFSRWKPVFLAGISLGTTVFISGYFYAEHNNPAAWAWLTCGLYSLADVLIGIADALEGK